MLRLRWLLKTALAPVPKKSLLCVRRCARRGCSATPPSLRAARLPISHHFSHHSLKGGTIRRSVPDISLPYRMHCSKPCVTWSLEHPCLLFIYPAMDQHHSPRGSWGELSMYHLITIYTLIRYWACCIWHAVTAVTADGPIATQTEPKPGCQAV